MKAKNIYKLGITISFLIAILPFIAYVTAWIMSQIMGCGEVVDLSVESCAGGSVIASLYVMSWFIVVTLPLGAFTGLLFYLLYVSVRRR